MTQINERPIRWIEADWPYGDRLRALTTTRLGGASEGVWSSFNLGDHVGDAPDHVASNRAILARHLGSMSVQWLEQVHGVRVVEAGQELLPRADAAWTTQPGQVLAVLTADCLPVVLADKAGRIVAAAHGGWRGLVDGILEETVAAMPIRPEVAWLGPAIGADVYEVGEEVLEQVIRKDVAFEAALLRGPRPARGFLDLCALAELQLGKLGVLDVYRSGLSSWDTRQFYSYRREGQTGRMATLAWLSGNGSHGDA